MPYEPQFWCVWCEGGGNPTVKHDSYPRAKAEAQRLARNNPGRRFVVLAAAAAFVKRDVDEVRFTTDPYMVDQRELDDEVPF